VIALVALFALWYAFLWFALLPTRVACVERSCYAMACTLTARGLTSRSTRKWTTTLHKPRFVLLLVHVSANVRPHDGRRMSIRRTWVRRIWHWLPHHSLHAPPAHALDDKFDASLREAVHNGTRRSGGREYRDHQFPAARQRAVSWIVHSHGTAGTVEANRAIVATGTWVWPASGCSAAMRCSCRCGFVAMARAAGKVRALLRQVQQRSGFPSRRRRWRLWICSPTIEWRSRSPT